VSWPLVALKDVACVNPRLAKDIDETQEVVFLPMAAISAQGQILAQEKRILSETRKGFTYFEKNDVVVAKITPCFENGKAAYLDNLETQIGFGTTEFHVIRPNIEKLDGKYLFYLIWNNQFRHLGERNMSGSAGQKRVPTDFLKNLEIPLPPLAEQERIAAILDKADAIRRKRQQAINLADDFLRSVFLDMFGDPMVNPHGWTVKPLSELIAKGDKLNYGVVQPGDVVEGGIPLIRSGDLYDVTPDVKTLRTVSNQVDEKHKRSRIKGNEILVACVGSIGKMGWVTKEMVGWNIARAVTRIPLSHEVNREYVYRYLQSPVIQGYFQQETRAVAQPTLNVGLIGKTPIVLPPIELQKQFLAKFERIALFKKKMNEELMIGSKLFGSLSQQAFAGEL